MLAVAMDLEHVQAVAPGAPRVFPGDKTGIPRAADDCDAGLHFCPVQEVDRSGLRAVSVGEATAGLVAAALARAERVPIVSGCWIRTGPRHSGAAGPGAPDSGAAGVSAPGSSLWPSVLALSASFWRRFSSCLFLFARSRWRFSNW